MSVSSPVSSTAEVINRSLSSTIATEASLAQPNPMAKKVSKVLEIKLDNPQMISSLEALSGFYEENTLKSRRHLRGDVEKRSMSINKQFLEAFEQVDQQLKGISQEIGAMTTSCDEMQRKLGEAKTQTSHLVGQMGKLKKDKDKIAAKKEMTGKFLEKFTLTQEEIDILSSSQDLKPEFFKALAHLRQIHSECKALLTTEHQRAGLEIMESMAIYQETGFEKLFRWTQSEMRVLGRETADLPLTLHRAMYALKDRPVLFNTCLEEVCNVRRTLIIRTFIDALTRGGPGGTPKPIELHAHDPMRYVGDMLAWLHQAAASERELLDLILTPPMTNQESSQEEFPDPEEPGVKEARIVGMLGRIMEGTCRPMRIRVEQVISSQQASVTCFKLGNLIQFYLGTITKVVARESQLSKILSDLSQVAFRVFMDKLNTQMEKLIRHTNPTSDFTPPPQLQEATSLLKDIMSSFDSSLVPTTEKEAAFAPVLTAVLTPAMQMCALSSTTMNNVQTSIFMVNCLHFLQNALLLYPFTSSRAQNIDKQIETYLVTLVEEQHSYLLNQSGLFNVTKLMKKAVDRGESPISTIKGLEATTLTDAMKTFEKFLYSVNLENSLYRSISSSRLARQTNQRAARLFLGDFKMISEVVFEKTHRYEFPSTIVTRTPQEAETLLGIDKE